VTGVHQPRPARTRLKQQQQQQQQQQQHAQTSHTQMSTMIVSSKASVLLPLVNGTSKGLCRFRVKLVVALKIFYM